jgi:hypothetical protein
LVLLVAFAAQIMVWQQWRYVRPDLAILSQPPSALGQAAVAFGDKAALYRVWAMDVQNAGDTGGRVTPLASYDYALVRSWLETLDTLDYRSNWAVAMAAHYFSQTKVKPDLRQMIAYMGAHVRQDYPHKWRWLAHAVNIARFRLNDQKLALALAYELSVAPVQKLPVWARQLPAFILRGEGDHNGATQIMKILLATEKDSLPPEEIAFMLDFIAKQESQTPSLPHVQAPALGPVRQ